VGWQVVKNRIIPVQLLNGDRLVKTRGFEAPRDVGDPVASSRVYCAQDADELLFLNISREERSVAPLLDLLERVSRVCFMPLALGGGIRSFDDAAMLIKHGADKVVVNSAAYRAPQLISKIAETFGRQAVIVAIDVRREPNIGLVQLYSDCGRVREEIRLEDHLAIVLDHGAGEIFIQSIDRDGTMVGYDVPLIAAVCAQCGVPVIACGGAGHYNHLREAFLAAEVSGLACGSLFNFGDSNPIRAKAFLSNYGLKFKVV
jgi:imidazole glycerol-phosphate synthase subunit HisF